MPHFFISYAKKDTRELALALNEKLNALPGVTAWVDQSLRAGRSWELQIQTEINRCDYMLVLYSPDINRHLNGEEESYVLTEISYAKYTVKKPIIPIMAQKTAPPMTLTMAHYIDFTLVGLQLDDLVTAICSEAELTVGAQYIAPTIRSKVYDLLPAPFEWIDIPAGKVTLEKGGYLNEPTAFDVTAFVIAKYPITNAQFAKFVEAGGYRERKWWTEAGWQTREQEGWAEPQDWQDKKWNGAEYPVVGVSWYEALAFCQWLSDQVPHPPPLARGGDIGEGLVITLPTEQQWQHAAQCNTGRTYPWGEGIDATYANYAEKVGKTTPVTQYPKGATPEGVYDLAGNVWEWCLTEYETGSQTVDNNYVLRGGSWYYFRDNARADARYFASPINRNNDFGFRIVCPHLS